MQFLTLRWIALDKWVKLHIWKTFLNFAVRFLNRLIPDTKPQYPQTQLLENVYGKLLKAYAIEAYCGRFDDVPYQTIEALKDKNFLNVLELSRKVLFYLGDMDRYYRQWLGLFFLLIQDELNAQKENMTHEEFFKLVKAQWEFDMTGAFPEEHFNAHKDEFQKILLSNSLSNVAK
jgi:hypothetical protein